MFKSLLGWVFFLIACTIGYAQEISITGQIRDKKTGEPLVGATVFIINLQQGTLTDEKGTFYLKVAPGKYDFLFSYIGYRNDTVSREISKNARIEHYLQPEISALNEVTVEAAPLKQKLLSPQMSINSLSAREAKLLPAIFGEVDILKTLQLKPGIKSGGEGSSGLYIRGGGADQNLFLIDNATVYNPSHLFGFFSIFNSESVENVQVYKGGFPAKWGGRLSSIVEVKTREGDNQTASASGGIGLISSRLTLESPLNKNSSLLLAGRRTYIDVFTRLINSANKENDDFDPFPHYFFYDLNGKLSYRLGERDEITLGGYLGNDKIQFNNNNLNFNFNWGNKVIQSEWTHSYNSKLSSALTLFYTSYNYQLANNVSEFDFKLGSQISDYTALFDFEQQSGKRHLLKYGISSTYHNFRIGRLRAANKENDVEFSSGSDYSSGEYGVYVSDEFNANSDLILNAGIRLSGFSNGDRFFGGVEPRFGARYSLSDQISLKANYAKMYQYVHLASNSSASLPTDIWYPSNRIVKPEVAQQVAVGVNYLTPSGKFLITNELYYKWMDRQIDFRDGAQLFVNDNLDEEFVFGKGRNYGNEFYLEKKQGSTTGWIGYTLSWALRQFDLINEGRSFYARHDRRHDVSVVVMHNLSKRLSVSGTWVYATGNAVTLPAGRFILQDVENLGPKVIPVVEKRNDYRIKPYHRLDLGIVYKFSSKWGDSDLTFSVYNSYNRRNVYFLYFEEIKNEEGITTGFQAKQVSLFPIIPSITYNFKFSGKMR